MLQNSSDWSNLFHLIGQNLLQPRIICLVVLHNSLEELAPEGVRKLSHHVGLSIHPAFNLQMLITHYIYRVHVFQFSNFYYSKK